MVLRPLSPLNTVSWPHNLLPAGLLNEHFGEELFSWMVLGEAYVILRMPISTRDYQIEQVSLP